MVEYDSFNNALERLASTNHNIGRYLVGLAFYMKVTKITELGAYQDGSPIDDGEIQLYHANNESPIQSMLRKCVCASTPTHGIESLWLHSPLALGDVD